MIKALGYAADRLLSAVVPKTIAAACCAPDCFYQYKNETSGGHCYRYKRYCCYTCTCSLNCNPWVFVRAC
jgi:hypothetical protein